MKNLVFRFSLLIVLAHMQIFTYAQNVGIHTLTPQGKLHIKGSDDASQLIIEADTVQSNTNPLIKFRKSTGADLMWIHADDSTNVFVGFKAGRVNVIGPQGINNTFVGSRAGSSNTNGRDNTAIGMNALFSNTKSSLNTAIGTNALYTLSFSPGGQWYQSNNVAVGYEALYSNQPTSSSSGANNTAIGTSALRSNTTASQNTAIGTFVLSSNTLGANNTANGYAALNSNTTASENTALGSRAMLIQSYSSGGVAWVSANVAVGFEALYANQPTTPFEGRQNTAVGHTALRANTIGWGNASTGYASLVVNTTGYYNTANGAYALYSNSSGFNNTGIGGGSLYATSTGSQNTAIGDNSCSYNTTGSNNTSIGYGAYYSLFAGQNTSCIGSGAGSSAGADNRIEIGNASNDWIGGQVGWSTFSDSRIKDNVAEDVPGIDFIKRLRPVTYNLNIHRENDMAYKGKKEMGEWDSKYDIEKTKMTGFLAQDVELAAREIGYDFSGVQKPENPEALYSLRYSDFVMPLVKAVQEQQIIIETLQEQVNTLQAEITDQTADHAQIKRQQEQIDVLLRRMEALEKNND